MKHDFKIDPTQLPAVFAFTRVARHGSFSRAADELGISPSALSQTVRHLEARLGVRLLNRTTRQVGLTEAGALLLAGVLPGLAQIESALVELEDQRDAVSGTLRINLPRLAYYIAIAPHLGGFMREHPELRLEFALDDGFADIVGGGFDAGIRFGESVARDMVAARLGGEKKVVVAGSPDYFSRHGTPQKPPDLLEHDCLRYRFVSSGRLYDWEFSESGRIFDIQLDGSLIFNDIYAMREAARAGLGLIHITQDVIADDLASGALVMMLGKWALPMSGLYLYYPNRAQMPRKLRAFIDWFQAANSA